MNQETRNGIRRELRGVDGGHAELARMLGISRPFLSRWLQGAAKSARLDREVPCLLEELHEKLRRQRIESMMATERTS
jgi:transcriptional regulator with XRE-family HTH domain